MMYRPSMQEDETGVYKNLRYRKALSDIGRKLTDDDLRSIRFICKAVDGLTKRDLELEDPLEFFEKLEERGVLSFDDTDFLKQLLDMVHRRDCVALLEQYENGLTSLDGNSYNRQPVQATGHSDVHNAYYPARNSYHPTDDDGQGSGRDSPDGVGVPHRTSKVNIVAPMPVRPNRGVIEQVTESSWGEDLSDAFDIVVEEIGRDWRQLARRLHLTETEIERISEDHMRNLREQSVQSLLLWKKKMRSRATKAALVEALKKCKMLYIADRLEGCQFR